MRIGICDDERIIREELSLYCNKYKEACLTDCNIISAASGEELLKQEEPIDILFLDVQMKGLDGLTAARQLRRKDENVKIIFVTGHTDFMQEGYEVKAFRYLLKPLKEEEILRTLREAVEEITKDAKVPLSKDGKTRFVKLKDILYIEYANRSCLVRTRRDCYVCKQPMSAWEQILNNGDFYRVHKSFIVNMAYVEEIGKCILMENGERVELAFRQASRFKLACREYRRRNAGSS